jgi:hypothetical protein
MATGPGDTFDPFRVVSGPEAVAVLERVEAVAAASMAGR